MLVRSCFNFKCCSAVCDFFCLLGLHPPSKALILILKSPRTRAMWISTVFYLVSSWLQTQIKHGDAQRWAGVADACPTLGIYEQMVIGIENVFTAVWIFSPWSVWQELWKPNLRVIYGGQRTGRIGCVFRIPGDLFLGVRDVSGHCGPSITGWRRRHSPD